MSLDNFKQQYEAAMREQGVTVTWNEDGGSPYGTDTGGYRNPDNWVATLTRDGYSREALVTLGRIAVTGMTADQLAQQDIWSMRQGAAQSSPQGQLPSSWYTTESEDTRRFYEVYPHLRPGFVPRIPPPGPTTTMNSGGHTIQPEQSPNVPNDGTRVTNPAPTSSTTDGLRLTFWQWNHYYELQTGRVGPAPEDVGVAIGTQTMTGPEWARITGAWYGGAVTVPAVTGGATGGVGATETGGGVAVGATGGTPDGGTPVGAGTANTSPAGPGAGAARNSFWGWNALREQSTGIVGDDPSHYGIQGGDLMTLEQWTALTAAYYAARAGGGNGNTGAKDNTVLYAAAAVVLILLLRRGS